MQGLRRLQALQCELVGLPLRALLALATGSGKTVLAGNLLWRLNQAGRLTKPALFLCDRDELRQQALGKLRNIFGDAVRVVGSSAGENSARNARVHIATYQTLGLDDDAAEVASFLTRHYPEPDSFSVIIIDECHRSAWNRWRVVLERNPNAIQIGLTATPRELRDPKRQHGEDRTITANNLAYFGPPVYEYGLIQAQEDGYLAACEIVRRAVSVDGQTFTDVQVVGKKAKDIRTGRRVGKDELKPTYGARRFDLDLVIPERIAAMCADLFEQLCANGGPEQKVIVFCTRDLHADRVAQQLGNRYVAWCKEHGQTPKDRYAFKCTDQGGAELIETFRGSGQRCFIACTVDLLATGVDIERLNAVCFFRYLESSIGFYQMLGRGTRIHEETGKYKFWLYDYTGVTDLFGTDFITADPTRRSKGKGTGGDDGDGGGDPALVVEMPLGKKDAEGLGVRDAGRMVPILREGRQVLITLDEYRAMLTERLQREAGNLDEFRSLWIEQRERSALIEHLRGGQVDPSRLREWEHCPDLDLYDLLAHHGFAVPALTRQERGDGYLIQSAPWLDSLDPQAAAVLRGFGHQFAVGGTESLESPNLWDVPEIRRAGGFYVLGRLDRPAVEIMREAKVRLFSV